MPAGPITQAVTLAVSIGQGDLWRALLPSRPHRDYNSRPVTPDAREAWLAYLDLRYIRTRRTRNDLRAHRSLVGAR